MLLKSALHLLLKLKFQFIEETLHKDANYDVGLHIDSVQKVNDWMKNSLYGYLTCKRLAFPVVKWFVRNNWGKYRIQKVTMNTNDFFFLSSRYKGC